MGTATLIKARSVPTALLPPRLCSDRNCAERLQAPVSLKTPSLIPQTFVQKLC